MSAQPSIAGGRVVMVDPVTDAAAFPIPPDAPGAGLVSGPRILAANPRPPVPVTPLIKMPPPPGTVGRLKRLPSGRMYVTPSNLGQPAAILAVTPPSINTDPPPGLPVVEQQPNGSYVVYPLAYFNAGIGSNGGDEGQINYALLQSVPQGAPVQLAPYPFLTQGPVAFASSAAGASVLEGTCPVVGEAAGTSGLGIFGAVIRPQGTWAGGGLPNAGAVYMAPTVPNGGTKMFGPVLRDLWIDLRQAAAGTHGLSAYGQVNHGIVTGVGIWGNSSDSTADAIRLDQDAGGEGNNQPDGWHFDTVMAQAYGRYGAYLRCNDTDFTNVHMQGAPLSTTDAGCFYLAHTNNVRFSQCRADQSIWGWIIDSNPGGNPNTPGASIVLTACGSENIYHSAVYLTNSSTTGQQTRTPVTLTGCSLDFAGRDLTSAAVRVEGWNLLTMDHVQITNGGLGYPLNGMEFHSIGTGPGVPSLVEIDGGIWNPATGGAYFVNPGTPTLLRYRFYGAIGAIQGGAAPVNPTLQVSTPWP